MTAKEESRNCKAKNTPSTKAQSITVPRLSQLLRLSEEQKSLPNSKTCQYHTYEMESFLQLIDNE